jgi:hypothetical protein
MEKSLLRTVIGTSVLSAVAASTLTMFAMPRFGQSTSAMEGVTLQPAVYTTGVQDSGYQQVYEQPRLVRRPVVRRTTTYSAPEVRRVRTVSTAERDVYGETITKRRSTGKSVAIVAGSAGAGAAVGALAGGKKGAAIGAISGGVAGFIYDRMTANKNN